MAESAFFSGDCRISQSEKLEDWRGRNGNLDNEALMPGPDIAVKIRRRIGGINSWMPNVPPDFYEMIGALAAVSAANACRLLCGGPGSVSINQG